MKRVAVAEAIGLRLAHDVTRIVPGRFKEVDFRRGHLIRWEDISKLLDLGKQHVYVLDLKADELHEDDAARRISRAAAGKSGHSRADQYCADYQIRSSESSPQL
jgi:hypothetical protein